MPPRFPVPAASLRSTASPSSAAPPWASSALSLQTPPGGPGATGYGRPPRWSDARVLAEFHVILARNPALERRRCHSRSRCTIDVAGLLATGPGSPAGLRRVVAPFDL